MMNNVDNGGKRTPDYYTVKKSFTQIFFKIPVISSET